jgi:hypothetical protein
MQYWIFYVGGVGGDGFRNLLEHADNITPADNKKCWKINPGTRNGKIMFSRVDFVSDGWFLRNHKNLDLSQLELLPTYRHLVETRQNTVISVHPWDYNFDPKFKYWDFLEQDQHKILLYSPDYQRVYEDFADKNFPQLEFLKNLKKSDPIHSVPNINPAECTLIDIEQVWRNWDYLNNILISIGISLDRKYYEEYLDVSKRRPK